jgi:hypothetical protein
METISELKENHTVDEAMNFSTVLRLKGHPDNQVIITEELTCLQNIKTIDRMMTRLARSSGELFTVASCARSRRLQVRQTELGKEFVLCCGFDLELIKQTYPDNVFSPYFSLFERHIAGSKFAGEKVYPERVPEFNELVDQIRSEAMADDFTKVLANHERASRKNSKSLEQYLDAMREAYSKLLIVRLDLHYGKRYVVPWDRVDAVSRGVARRHRREFIKHVKKSYPGLVGYVWKTERGAIKSFHTHLLLIFNGQLLRADETIGMQLGEYWIREITNGKGTYWNCNAKKGDYSNLAIGMVHHDDDATWVLLKKIAMYLTKVDAFVKDNAPKKERSFGKGGIPKLMGKRKGRPRGTSSTSDKSESSDSTIASRQIKPSGCASPSVGRAGFL